MLEYGGHLANSLFNLLHICILSFKERELAIVNVHRMNVLHSTYIIPRCLSENQQQDRAIKISVLCHGPTLQLRKNLTTARLPMITKSSTYINLLRSSTLNHSLSLQIIQVSGSFVAQALYKNDKTQYSECCYSIRFALIQNIPRDRPRMSFISRFILLSANKTEFFSDV